jgi:cell division protein FtsB
MTALAAVTMARTRRTWLLVGAVALVGLLFVAVFPARTYLDQRSRRQAVVSRLKATDAKNRALQKRINTLHTDAEVERLAREQYNLVRPGEEAYAILPTRTPPPATDPARANQKSEAKAKAKQGWFARTWHTVTSIF